MIDFDALSHLKSVSSLVDDNINIGVTALALVATDHDGIVVHRHIQHLEKLQSLVAQRYNDLVSEGADDDAFVRIAALKHVLYDRYGYFEDQVDSEPLDHADLIRVIDRGKGCVSALCVLYIDVARANGWVVRGVDFPAGYLCRIEHAGQRFIFDPAQQCKTMEAHDLRALLKRKLGEQAELTMQDYAVHDARETLIHLCNILKIRRIEMGDYDLAVDLIERMRLVAPDDYSLLLDCGVLYMRLRENDRAIDCLERYIETCSSSAERYEAELLLRDLLL